MTRLTEQEIASSLAELPGWTRAGDAITKTFRLQSFREAITFVDRLAATCDAANHHPDILIRYRRVTLTFSTHSEGGLTEKDMAGAREAERLAPLRSEA